jgi:hypothetical protein
MGTADTHQNNIVLGNALISVVGGVFRDVEHLDVLFYFNEFSASVRASDVRNKKKQTSS